MLRLAIITGIYSVLVPTALGTTAAHSGGAFTWGIEPDAGPFVSESRPIWKPEPSATKRIIQRASDGMFYLQGSVNGHPVRFLIDTGASHIVLSGADAERVGVNGRPISGENIATVSGRIDTRWAPLDHVEIAGKDFWHLRAAVVDSGLDVSLLGQNALAQLGRLTFDGDELRLN